MTHVHMGEPARAQTRGRLAIVFWITIVLALLEFVGNRLSDALTLLADAGHLLSDTGGLGLSLFAMWFSARPSPPHRTFGYQRAEILAALVNVLLLILVVGSGSWATSSACDSCGTTRIAA